MASTLNVSKIEPLTGSGTLNIGSSSSNTIQIDTTNQRVTAPGELRTNTIQGIGANTVNFTAPMTVGGATLAGRRNLIINGAMTIDQRNSGSAITSAGYVVDRFHYQNDSDATLSLQQSSTVPDNFTNSISVTVTTADASVGAAQYSMITQRIEGYNIANLGWGTSAARAVTLSFYVRSSVTGTFGGVLNNDGSSRSYPFTYSISSADTWEKKTITIEGDTSGTWNTTNSSGIQLRWAFGMGSTYAGTAGSWSGSSYFGASGAVDLISTLNATWYITGVQLEVGTVATPFEHASYGDELARCERYFQRFVANEAYTAFSVAFSTSATSAKAHLKYNCKMRSKPTITQSNSGFNYGPQVAFSSFNTLYTGLDLSWIDINIGNVGGANVLGHWNANNNAAAYVQMDAEL